MRPRGKGTYFSQDRTYAQTRDCGDKRGLFGGRIGIGHGLPYPHVLDRARLGQPEISLGIIPGSGGTQRGLGWWEREKLWSGF